MAKRFYFGWIQGVKKETGKAYKLLCLGSQSERWHGYEINVKYCPPEVQIPNCKPGALIHLEFDENGFIDKDTPITVVNG